MVVYIALVIIQICIVQYNSWNANAIRSSKLFDSLTDQIMKDIPKEHNRYLIYVSSENDKYSKGFFMSKQLPFALRVNISQREDFPLFADTLDMAMAYLCGQVHTHSVVMNNVPIQFSITENDIYSWYMTDEGRAIPIHQEVRNTLRYRQCLGACYTCRRL